MPHFKLSKEAENLLSNTAWHKERQVDISKTLVFLRDRNIEASPIASDFLKMFSGLSLHLPNGGLSGVNFDVRETMTYLVDGDLAQLESLVGRSLCPVGCGGRFLLFIAPSGEMIFLHDEWLMYLRARNVHDGFETIRTLEFQDVESIMLTDDQKPIGFRDTNSESPH